MRVYLPATLTALAEAHRTGTFRPVPDLPGHAVTPALREASTDTDSDELEFAALLDAAETSLRALAREPAAPRRRVVLAADLDDLPARPDADQPSAVDLPADVPLDRVVSVHVDEATDSTVTEAVAAAVTALPAAGTGDEAALATLDEAADHDLLWYDVTEIPDLL